MNDPAVPQASDRQYIVVTGIQFRILAVLVNYFAALVRFTGFIPEEVKISLPASEIPSSHLFLYVKCLIYTTLGKKIEPPQRRIAERSTPLNTKIQIINFFDSENWEIRLASKLQNNYTDMAKFMYYCASHFGVEARFTKIALARIVTNFNLSPSVVLDLVRPRDSLIHNKVVYRRLFKTLRSLSRARRFQSQCFHTSVCSVCGKTMSLPHHLLTCDFIFVYANQNCPCFMHAACFKPRVTSQCVICQATINPIAIKFTRDSFGAVLFQYLPNRINLF